MPTLSSQMTSAVLTLKKAAWFNLQAIPTTPIAGNACAIASRLAQCLQWGICSTQPLASSGGSSTIWREGEGKKIPIRTFAHAVLCLLAWVFCWRTGTSAEKEERRRPEPRFGAEVPPAPGAVSPPAGGGEQRGRDRATRSVRRQTWLKFEPNGLWHKQHSSARDLQWI